jgi:DNA-binding transcriptional MerR regulator
MSEQRLSEEEASEMIQRAAASREPERGFTLAEIREMAAELGIDPDKVQPTVRSGSKSDLHQARPELNLNLPVVVGWCLYFAVFLTVVRLQAYEANSAAPSLFLASIVPVPFLVRMFSGRRLPSLAAVFCPSTC